MCAHRFIVEFELGEYFVVDGVLGWILSQVLISGMKEFKTEM